MLAILACAALAAAPETASAAADELPEPRWGVGGVPVAGYSSDIGLTVGAASSLFYFAGHQRPYRLSVSAHVLYSTGGVFEVGAGVDLPAAFGTSQRLTLSAVYSHTAFNPFYGLSNSASPDPSRPRGYYTFNQRTPSVSLLDRWPLGGAWFGFAGYRLESISIGIRPDSLLADSGGSPVTDRRYAEAVAGLLHDTRDVEADPRHGHLWELSARGAHAALGSEFDAAFAYLSLAFYRSVLPRLVIAARAAGQVGAGEMPLPVMADFGGYAIVQGLGGASTLRGYLLQQFLGPVKVLGNLEARYRFIDARAWGHPFVLSGVLFADTGRVAGTPGPDAGGLWGLHSDAGAGARITWEESFVLRADVGVSPGQVRLFVTLGQVF